MTQLKSFVVLAEQLHFGNASRLLNVSQPALTKQIKRLEEDLGARLFERSVHGTKLSELGSQWLSEAADLVQRFDSLLERGKNLAQGKSGRLRIGFGYHSLEVVPNAVVRLRHSNPGIQISLRDASTKEQLAELEAGELDLAFVRMPVEGMQGFASRQTHEDRMALVTLKESHNTIRQLADCRELPFVTIAQERSPGFFGHMLTICANQGFHPRIVQQVSEFPTALALVRAGMGVSIIPESYWNSDYKSLTLHRLPQAEAIWRVSALWRKEDKNPALQQFLSCLDTPSK